jgi:hypothetical protein
MAALKLPKGLFVRCQSSCSYYANCPWIATFVYIGPILTLPHRDVTRGGGGGSGLWQDTWFSPIPLLLSNPPPITNGHNEGRDQRILNYLQSTRLSRRCMIWLLTLPLPSSASRFSLSQSSCVSPVAFADGMGKGRGWREAKSCDGRWGSLVLYQ